MVVYTRFLSLLEMVWSFIPDFFVYWRWCGRLYTSFLRLYEMVWSFIPDFLVCWRWCGRLYQIS